MIQGFETRELTDQVIRPFIKSANGILHTKLKSVEQYEQTNWPTFNSNELTKHPIVVFGISISKTKYKSKSSMYSALT